MWRHKLEPLQPLTRLSPVRLLSAAAIIAATTPSQSVHPVTKETGRFLKFLSAGFRPTVNRVSIPAAPAFRAPTPPSLVISSLSVAAIGTPTVLPPPRSPAIWLSQVTPVCRSQKLLTSQATTLVTRDSEPPYPTDAVSAFDGKVFVRDVTVT